MSSSMTSKGQITVPINLRNKYHLDEGSKIYFEEKNGVIVLIPSKKHKLSDLFGCLPKPTKSLSIEEINEVIETHK